MVIVLPLRALLFQALFLLISIALESFILQITMYLSRRTSIEYAASINLSSTIFGWIFFFCFERLISTDLNRQLINFIFFGRFAPELGVSFLTIYFYLGLFCFLSFMIIIFIEYIALDIIIKLNQFKVKLNIEIEKESQGEPSNKTAIQKGKIERQRAKNLLIANAYSQSLILVILFLIQSSKF